MLGFVPPLQEKKKRRDEGEDEEEVGVHLKSVVEHCPLSREKYILVDPDWFTPWHVLLLNQWEGLTKHHSPQTFYL